MNANFEYYKVFYYVSKYENMTKAASVLKTSQPAVTRTIHNLENILGCRLFTRSKSGMKLHEITNTSIHSPVPVGVSHGDGPGIPPGGGRDGQFTLCPGDNGVGIHIQSDRCPLPWLTPCRVAPYQRGRVRHLTAKYFLLQT